MYKLACLFIILFLFVGCDDKGINKEELYKGYSLKPINFLNKKAYIPSGFKKINLNEIGEMLRQNPDLNPIDKMNYQMAASAYNNSGKVPVLYQDSTATGNAIWFFPGPYIPLNKDLVNDCVQMLESSFIIPAENFGIRSERLEAKFIQNNLLKSIKVKYKLDYKDSTKYLTQFIIRKDLTTYSMVVSSNKIEDHQKILKSL